uniref:Uncharacterized protein n=1 Tax=Amphimedon queenslandica TaxID=400682 RepID=A0A1X7UEU5_AMPQE
MPMLTVQANCTNELTIKQLRRIIILYLYGNT